MSDIERLSHEDFELIVTIVDRGVELMRKNVSDTPVDIYEQLTFIIARAHLKIGLQLKELSEADDYNLMHDVIGIYNHIEYESGQMKDAFSPRYADV